MKNYFFPDCKFGNIYEITADFLLEKGIKVVIYDIDKTLVPYETAEPDAKLIDFIKEYENRGLKLAIASNNHMARVERFASKLGVFAIWDSNKPSKRAVLAACQKFSVKPSECAIIGDQIFTDVLCATASGALSILVTPIPGNESRFIRFKRKCEKPILKAYEKHCLKEAEEKNDNRFN